MSNDDHGTPDARHDPPICDYEGSTYRTDFWEGKGRQYEDGAERLALGRLMPQSGRRLVEIGAGFGRLADLYDGYDQVVLLDYSQSQLAYARERLGDRRFLYVAADLYRLPLAANVVDTCVMVRVLHHLADVPRALAHVSRAVRPGGSFVLEFANKRHAKNVARFLLGRGVDPFAPEPYEFAELHYDFHPRWVTQRLDDAGLSVDRRLSVSLLRSVLLKRTLPLPLLLRIEGLLQVPLSPLTPGASVLVRCLATKPGETELAEDGGLFQCPDCGHGPLQAARRSWKCNRCGREWPIVDGIHVFK